MSTIALLIFSPLSFIRRLLYLFNKSADTLVRNDLAILSNDIAADDGSNREALALHADKCGDLVEIEERIARDLPFLLRIDDQQICIKADLDVALLAVDAECLCRQDGHGVCQNRRGNAALDTALVEGDLESALDAADAAPYVEYVLDLVAQDLIELLVVRGEWSLAMPLNVPSMT